MLTYTHKGKIELAGMQFEVWGESDFKSSIRPSEMTHPGKSPSVDLGIWRIPAYKVKRLRNGVDGIILLKGSHNAHAIAYA